MRSTTRLWPESRPFQGLGVWRPRSPRRAGEMRLRHYVFANVSDTRPQKRVLQFLNRERELSRTGFEEIVLDLRVQVSINDGAIGFQHGRRRQRRHGVLHECSSGRAVLMIATKGSPRRVRLDDARSMRCVNDLFTAVVVAI